VDTQISVEVVIKKLTEQIANQAVRIATLEAFVEQQAEVIAQGSEHAQETPEAN